MIISIANEKGGVAKTTTALSLGAALVETGLKVLLIDLDAQANLTLALGIEPGKVQRSAGNILLESAQPSRISRETGIPGLDIIPANNEMTYTERYLPSRPGYEMVLRKALQDPELDYDYILIDCPPFLGAVTLDALTASNLLIMPTQAEFFSVYALRNMMTLIRRVRAQTNPHLTYRLLITLFDRRNRVHRTLAEQLHTTFSGGLLETVIETDTKLRESPIAGLPIIYHSPKTRSAIQYRALAQEIIEYVKETSAEPA
ncbi:ParA family protein [Longilinea arvoryzae]|uniref:ParA family protein n=1 Tax=Longilinea arvoryzae TaxID=360412 RepID=UPI001561548F|nr:ParA family protein [Longilinea arvoryzae]